MNTITLTGLYFDLPRDTSHLESRLMGFDPEDVLDAMELATEARTFLNNSSIKQYYLLVVLEGETYGAGFKLEGECVVLTTLLTPVMVVGNDKNRKGFAPVTQLSVA